jgi:aminopeptidase N
MDQVAPIIKAVASLLWPFFAFTVMFLFKSEISQMFHRLTKAEILGQKVELSEEVQELDASAVATAIETTALRPEQRRIPSVDEDETIDATIKSILQQATRDPKLALMALAAELEKQARQALATRGVLGTRRVVSLSQALSELNQYGFPPNLAGAVAEVVGI